MKIWQFIENTRPLTPPYTWRPWFAWHPVTIGNGVYWLQNVERRVDYWIGEDHDLPVWEYRL